MCTQQTVLKINNYVFITKHILYQSLHIFRESIQKLSKSNQKCLFLNGSKSSLQLKQLEKEDFRTQLITTINSCNSKIQK